MPKVIQFGEDVPGYDIRVLNEREVRAAAGLYFLAISVSLSIIFATGNFVPIKYVVSIFLLDFIIRVFISPRYSPTLILGRLIVSRQVPEYVGAPQKRFAWIIGVILASIMFVFLVLVDAYSPITGFTCLICLVFLFFESSFGICLGCLLYRKKAQYCPGEVCDRKSRQDIQKTSLSQLMMVFGLALYISFLAVFFNRDFQKPPYDLFNPPTHAKGK
jgi:hypothetical protein